MYRVLINILLLQILGCVSSPVLVSTKQTHSLDLIKQSIEYSFPGSKIDKLFSKDNHIISHYFNPITLKVLEDPIRSILRAKAEVKIKYRKSKYNLQVVVLMEEKISEDQSMVVFKKIDPNNFKIAQSIASKIESYLKKVQ